MTPFFLAFLVMLAAFLLLSLAAAARTIWLRFHPVADAQLAVELVRAIIFTLIGLLSLAAVRRRWTFNESPRA